MGWSHYKKSDVDFEKEVDINIDTELDYDVDIDVYKDVDIDFDLDAYADVEGNIADVVFDIEAVGKDTFTEFDVTVLAVEDELSSISGSMTAVVG